jgi:hypothetical protein
VGKEALEWHGMVETQFKGSGEDGSSTTGLSTMVLEGGWVSASAGRTTG